MCEPMGPAGHACVTSGPAAMRGATCCRDVEADRRRLSGDVEELSSCLLREQRDTQMKAETILQLDTRLQERERQGEGGYRRGKGRVRGLQGRERQGEGATGEGEAG